MRRISPENGESKGESVEERNRRVVELRLLGFSTAEVARKLGLDADVLRVRLSRMRRRLRDKQVILDWL